MSLLNLTIAAELQDGAYTARVLEFKEVDDGEHKPYIGVMLSIDGNELEDRWYESRIPYIMKNLRRQFGKQFEVVDLSELLDLATKNDFAIVLETTDEYGQTVSYSAS